MRKLTALLAVALLFGLTTPLLALNYEIAPTPDPGFTTTKWLGDKYAGGNLSVLIFKMNWCYTTETAQVYELQRAFGWDIGLVVYQGTQYFGGTDNERARKLLDSRKWDVIVFWSETKGNLNRGYPDCSTDVKYRILAQVREGTGLVITDTAPKEIFRPERQYPAPLTSLVGGLGLLGRLPRDNADYFKAVWNRWTPKSEEEFNQRFVSTYQVGNGRAVVYNGWPIATYPFRDCVFVDWNQRVDVEYMMAELGRGILYAGGKEPQVEITGRPPARWDVPWGQAQGQSGGWRLNVLGDKRDLTVSWRLRDVMGNVLLQDKKAFPGATGEIECGCTLPDLGAGSYYLDLFVDSPQGRENYGYSVVRVGVPYKVALQTDHVGIEPGTPLQGEAMVQPTEEAGVKPELKSLTLKLVDIHDRVVDQQTLPVQAGTAVSYTFKTDPLYTTQVRVVPELLSGGRSAADHTYLAYNLLKRKQGEFNVAMWGETGGPYGFYGWRRAWQTGVTVSQGSRTFADLAISPTNFGPRDVNPKPDPVTGVLTLPQGSWNDPEALGKYLDTLDKVWQRGVEGPVYVYNIGDEGPHWGCDLTPAGLNAYRGWLREIYRDDLDALNTEWGSNYTHWGEVNVLDQTDNMENKAKEAGNYARWSDRLHWSEVNWARNMSGAMTRRAREYDPKALLGFEGSGRMWGIDYDELLANSGFTGMYRGITLEMLRSLAPPGYVYGYWTGYGASGEALISAAWDHVMQHAPSIWYFILDFDWLATNNEPYPDRQEYINDCILPLRRGLGDLLLQLDMPHDGIGIYYSVASCHASELSLSSAWNSSSLATENLVRLLQEAGYQYVFTTKTRVLNGDLQKRGIKVLFLPFVQPLGEDEVEALTRFVQEGGIVIADQRPGVMSGHCRPWDRGPADDLFGIERTGAGKPVRLAGETSVQFRGQALPLAITNNHGDGEIKAASATAGATLNDTPVFLVNALGKGQAVLWNFHVTGYNGERGTAHAKQTRDFIRALMSACGVKPRLERTEAGGGELTSTQTGTWNKGNVTLYALYRTGGDPTPAAVTLPQKRFVFDLTEGEKGNTDKVQIKQLRTGRAHFLATYPWDPGQPIVKPSATSARSGETVEFTFSMSGVPAAEQGTFSYYTRLVNPAGQWVDVIPWSVQGPGGRAKTHVRFAHNDPAGTWTLQVREITTGRSTTVKIDKK